MPKKPSGFMSFVAEWKKKTGKNISMPQAVEEAGKIWQNMSASEKARYKNDACNSKFVSKQPEKLDCHGRALSQVNKEREEAEQKERNMKRDIEATVKKSVRDGSFTSQKYYFVMVNYFLKTREGVHVPAELGIAQFSLKEGVHRRYHTLINPDVDIFGYQYDAQSHSNETHMLPLPPKALGESNLGTIFNQFIKFIRDPETDAIPPVYTHRNHMQAVKSVLNYMQADVEAVIQNVEVYSIQHLFFVMKEHASVIGEVDKPSSIYVTDAHFERDFFEYQDGIACAFHEEKDRSKYCALSYVVRWGYMFGDYMCHDVAIIPKPGCHIPANTKLNAITIAPEEDTPRQVKPVVKEEASVDDVWENRWANETQVLPDKTFSQDFPALGARKKSAAPSISSYAQSTAATLKSENLHITGEYDDYDLEPSNPWSRSQRKRPQEPDSSYYSVNFSLGTTQTFLPEDEASVSSNWPRAGNVRKTQTPGAGRGNLFQ